MLWQTEVRCRVCDLAMPYHCAGLRVLAGASCQDRGLWAGYGLCVALLRSQWEKKSQWAICLAPNSWIPSSSSPKRSANKPETQMWRWGHCRRSSATSSPRRQPLGGAAASLLQTLQHTHDSQHVLLKEAVITTPLTLQRRLTQSPHSTATLTLLPSKEPEPLVPPCITPVTQSIKYNTTPFTLVRIISVAAKYSLTNTSHTFVSQLFCFQLWWLIELSDTQRSERGAGRECSTTGTKLQKKRKKKLHERDINSQSVLQRWPRLHQKKNNRHRQLGMQTNWWTVQETFSVSSVIYHLRGCRCGDE